MEHWEALAGPRGPGPQAGLVDLPDELLLPILRRVEEEYVASGQMSTEFLQLRAVCKRLRQGVDSVVTNLSRGIASRFCSRAAVLGVRDSLQPQLARWGSLRRVELRIRGGPVLALAQLLPALGQSCPGLTALRIAVVALVEPPARSQGRAMAGKGSACQALAHLSSLASLESLSLTGFRDFIGRLPSLPSLRVLDTDFTKLTCGSPLPALEELAHGDKREIDPGYYERGTIVLDVPHMHALPRLRRLSLGLVCGQKLRLPRTLQVLELVNMDLRAQLRLDKDLLPELAELVVVHKKPNPFPVNLSKLLSHHPLLRLKLHGAKYLLVPGTLVPASLRLQTRLTALSLRAVLVPHLHEGLAALTALTELELGDLDELEALHFSGQSLQHLRLEGLPKLRALEGLELQVGLRSLTLANLDRLTRLPDLHLFPSLTELELTQLWLQTWSADSCSDLPSLKLLRVSEVSQLAPQAGQLAPQAAPVAPRQFHTHPHPTVPPFSLDLGTSGRLTELDLRGAAGPALDLNSLPLLKNLRLQDGHDLSRLSGHQPLVYNQLAFPGMQFLFTLNIASCPRLITFSFSLRHLQHLSMEDLPRLTSLGSLPLALRTIDVAACHSLERLDLGPRICPRVCDDEGVVQDVQPDHMVVQLRSVRLAGLAKLSGLVIQNAELLESVQVSECPLVELVLKNLPELAPPNFRINGLYLHAANSSALSSAASHPSPTLHPDVQPPPVYPPPPDAPPSLQGLRKLALIRIAGVLTLDQVALQTGLTHLALDGLHLSRLPRELASLTGLSELVLTDMEVESEEPLPPDAFPRLEKLTIAGCTDLVRRTGLGTGLGWSASPPQVNSGLVGPEIGAFRSITKLDLLKLKVASLDVSRLASIQELSVRDCESLTCLVGITNLLHLTSVKLQSIPELQQLAIVSCPSIKSLEHVNVSPLHLHLEDLPSLELDGGWFHTHKSQYAHCSQGAHSFPAARMQSLASLTLRGLPCLSIILKDLEAIETIEVTQCPFLNKVHLEKLMSLMSVKLNHSYGEALGEGSSSAPRPPHLMECLYLLDMPKLESVSCSSAFQNVVVRSCPAISSFPLLDRYHLQSLELEDVSETILPSWLKQARSLRKLEIRQLLLDG